MSTGRYTSIGKAMFVLSRLIQPVESRFHLLKQCTGDKRFVYPLMQLSIPAKIAVIQRVLEDFFKAPWCEGTSRFTGANAHLVSYGGELF